MVFNYRYPSIADIFVRCTISSTASDEGVTLFLEMIREFYPEEITINKVLNYLQEKKKTNQITTLKSKLAKLKKQ